MIVLNKVERELALQIMTNKSENSYDAEIIKELDNVCEECKKEDESVSQNLILTGFKICKSCRISKTIFPI